MGVQRSWIGTENGGLTSYSLGKFKTYTIRDGVPDDSIFSVLANPPIALASVNREGWERRHPACSEREARAARDLNI